MPQASIRRYLRHGTLPQLSVFEAVARLGSFTRAGEELYLAQPTVSVQIRKLADTVGAPLFEQVGKKVHLTEAGRTLQAACGRVFGALADVEERLADLRTLKGGRLRLAVTTAAASFAPRLLGAFAKAHPGVEIALQIHNRQVLAERLAANADDLYLFANPLAELDLVTVPLVPNVLVAFAPPAHPLARERGISFARLAQEPFLMREPGSGTHAAVQAAFAAHDVTPLVRMELASNEAIRQALREGLGISILPRHSYGTCAEPQGLVELDVAGLPIEQHWQLAYARGKQLSSVIEGFVAFARAEAGSLVPATSSARRPPAGKPEKP
jgi:DNA-binding transcriptional LysR family regulator